LAENPPSSQRRNKNLTLKYCRIVEQSLRSLQAGGDVPRVTPSLKGTSDE
jgi:hypothetical protein